MPTRTKVETLMTRDVAVVRQGLEVHELDSAWPGGSTGPRWWMTRDGWWVW